MPAAVDTLFLLALGSGDPTTLEANRLLQNEGYDVFCTNTPLRIDRTITIVSPIQVISVLKG